MNLNKTGKFLQKNKWSLGVITASIIAVIVIPHQVYEGVLLALTVYTTFKLKGNDE